MYQTLFSHSNIKNRSGYTRLLILRKTSNINDPYVMVAKKEANTVGIHFYSYFGFTILNYCSECCCSCKTKYIISCIQYHTHNKSDKVFINPCMDLTLVITRAVCVIMITTTYIEQTLKEYLKPLLAFVI